MQRPRYCYQITQQPQYLERTYSKSNTIPIPICVGAAAFDLGAIGHLEAAKAILNASLANSLKLLNLKRILETMLENDGPTTDQQEDIKILFQAIESATLATLNQLHFVAIPCANLMIYPGLLCYLLTFISSLSSFAAQRQPPRQKGGWKS